MTETQEPYETKNCDHCCNCIPMPQRDISDKRKRFGLIVLGSFYFFLAKAGGMIQPDEALSVIESLEKEYGLDDG